MSILIAHEAARFATKLGIKKMTELLTHNDKAVADVMSEQRDEILFNLQEAERKNATRLADCLTLKEAMALARPIYEEAFKAAEQERVSMLAHAIVGLFRPDLSLEVKSRVSRAITQLEPSDVILLRDVRFVNGPGKVEIYKKRGGPAFAPLVQAGCIYVEQGTFDGPGISVTEVGEALVELLREWITAPAEK